MTRVEGPGCRRVAKQEKRRRQGVLGAFGAHGLGIGEMGLAGGPQTRRTTKIYVHLWKEFLVMAAVGARCTTSDSKIH